MRKPLVVISLMLLLCLGVVSAQEHDRHEEEEHGPIHFSHPMITESASPDTKLRFDYGFQRFTDEDSGRVNDHASRVEFEYAFNHNVSVAVTVPYVFRRPETSPSSSHLDNIEISLKTVTFRAATRGFLPVYGISFGLPTGNDSGTGSDHVVEVEPFAGLGYKHKRLELIGFGKFGFKTNRRATDEEGHEFGYNFSSLYNATHRFQMMLEMDGHTALTGEEGTVVNLSPGIKFLHPDHHWQFGASVGWPVTQTKDFNIRAVFSVFYHF
jgi:hypothetical protein